MVFAAAGVVAIALAFGGGLKLDRQGSSMSAGTLEFDGPLMTPEGSIGGTASVRRVGTGRVVHVTSEHLPILPPREFYEVWFVGPTDAPDSPDRISAGTFHPDEDGRSIARLVAAADPARYPAIVITAEPGDGNPQATGPEVLRAPIASPP